MTKAAEMAWPRWPLFGRRTTLNAATYCAPISSIPAGQQRNGQVTSVRDTVYGSDANRLEACGIRPQRSRHVGGTVPQTRGGGHSIRRLSRRTEQEQLS